MGEGPGGGGGGLLGSSGVQLASARVGCSIGLADRRCLRELRSRSSGVVSAVTMFRLVDELSCSESESLSWSKELLDDRELGFGLRCRCSLMETMAGAEALVRANSGRTRVGGGGCLKGISLVASVAPDGSARVRWDEVLSGATGTNVRSRPDRRIVSIIASLTSDSVSGMMTVSAGFCVRGAASNLSVCTRRSDVKPGAACMLGELHRLGSRFVSSSQCVTPSRHTPIRLFLSTLRCDLVR